jgi:hypothetical protein
MTRERRFRRRLAVAAALMSVVLLVAFHYAVRSAGEAIAQERWVRHTQDVLSAIGDARLERLRLASQEIVRQFGMYWLMVNEAPPQAVFAGT